MTAEYPATSPSAAYRPTHAGYPDAEPRPPAHGKHEHRSHHTDNPFGPWPGWRIDTVTGLHGHLVAYWESEPDAEHTSRLGSGWAIVKRDDAPFPGAPYSIHYLYQSSVGELHAESGHYDLPLAEARERFARLTSRGLGALA